MFNSFGKGNIQNKEGLYKDGGQFSSFYNTVNSIPPSIPDFFLLENGDFFLLENGDKLILG